MPGNKSFSLLGKGLKLDTAEDIAAHIQPLKDSVDVEEIQFTGNTLGVGACEALATVLESKTTIQVAKFDDIFTSRLLSEIPPAVDFLLKACLKLPNLHTIDLSDNAFGLNTQAPLVSFLSQHVPLQHLFLNNNGMGPEAGSLIANALTELAAKKTKSEGAAPLKTVVCGRNRLEVGSMSAWAKCYETNTGVKVVKMVQNGIRQDGIQTLIKDGLKNVKGLQALDLQDNTFMATGAAALTDAVGGWTDLVELGISDSLYGARRFLALTEALAQGRNTKLQTLRLQFNDIDVKGVKALADALDKLPQLQRVELNGNIFVEDDVNIERIKDILSERREQAGADADDESWGVDELDELEEASDDEDEDEAEEEEEQDVRGTVLDRADQAESENVAQEKDKGVDDLADLLKQTEIK